jgi:hypothetical protein
VLLCRPAYVVPLLNLQVRGRSETVRCKGGALGRSRVADRAKERAMGPKAKAKGIRDGKVLHVE